MPPYKSLLRLLQNRMDWSFGSFWRAFLSRHKHRALQIISFPIDWYQQVQNSFRTPALRHMSIPDRTSLNSVLITNMDTVRAVLIKVDLGFCSVSEVCHIFAG